MIWLLGALDIISGIILILFKYFSLDFAWIFIFYLGIKSLIFITDVISIIDLIAVFFFILAMFGIYNILTIIFAVWIIQKGFFIINAFNQN